MDKLKGLKLGTNVQGLNASQKDKVQPNNWHNPLSPETSDVAFGSFSSFATIKGMPNPSTLAAKPAQTPVSPNSSSKRKMVAQMPPEAVAVPDFYDLIPTVESPDSPVISANRPGFGWLRLMH